LVVVVVENGAKKRSHNPSSQIGQFRGQSKKNSTLELKREKSKMIIIIESRKQNNHNFSSCRVGIGGEKGKKEERKNTW